MIENKKTSVLYSSKEKNNNLSEYKVDISKEKFISSERKKLGFEFISKKRNRNKMKKKQKISINSPYENKKVEELSDSIQKEKEEKYIGPAKMKYAFKGLVKPLNQDESVIFPKKIAENFKMEKKFIEHSNKIMNININYNSIKQFSSHKHQKENIKIKESEKKLKNIMPQSNILDSNKFNSINKDLFKKINKINNKIIVKNIGSCGINEIKEFFSCCGNIVKVKLPKNNRKDNEKTAIIYFKNKEECNIAIKKIGEKLKGNTIEVEYYTNVKKKEKDIKGENILNIEKIPKDIKEKEENNAKKINTDKVQKPSQSPKLIDEINKKLYDFGNEIKKYVNESINAINTKIGLLNLINQQNDKNLNIKMENNNNKINRILNQNQILYLRKVTNFIIEEIIKVYKNSIAKTRKKFELNNKKKKFGIIVARWDLKGISKYKINLVFDFLFNVRKNASFFVNLNNENIEIQKSIFYELFGKTNKSIENKFDEKKEVILDIKDMTTILLENGIHEKIKKQNYQDNIQLISFINKLINEEDINKITTEFKENLQNPSNNNIYSNLIEIMNGNIQKKSLLKNLADKVTSFNEEVRINNEFILKKGQEINSEYFYKEWLKTFKEENYKKDYMYCHFIKEEKMVSLDDIKNIINTLIPNFHANLFENEPGQFEDKIDSIINTYDIP